MFIRKLSLVAATLVALGLVGCSGAPKRRA